MSSKTLYGRIYSGGRVLAGAIRTDARTLAGAIPGELVFHYADNAPEYLGDYEVTPTPDGFTLETAGHLMRYDLAVNGIPYFEVSNNSGGNTVYIGDEKEINFM